jgi:hypothetical protein
LTCGVVLTRLVCYTVILHHYFTFFALIQARATASITAFRSIDARSIVLAGVHVASQDKIFAVCAIVFRSAHATEVCSNVGTGGVVNAGIREARIRQHFTGCPTVTCVGTVACAIHTNATIETGKASTGIGCSFTVVSRVTSARTVTLVASGEIDAHTAIETRAGFTRIGQYFAAIATVALLAVTPVTCGANGNTGTLKETWVGNTGHCWWVVYFTVSSRVVSGTIACE